MSAGNAPEQIEAALVESLITSVEQSHEAKEIKRTYSVDEHGNLVIDSYLLLPKPLENIVIDLRTL